MVEVTAYLIVAVASVAVYYLFFKKNKNEAPGPRFRLPFLGHAIQVGQRPYLTFTKWKKMYGDIVLCQLGPNKCLVINDHKLAKEMFNDPNFSGRVQDELFLVIPEGSYGVLNTQRETWEAQRRFTLRHLRDFGFGKSSLEALILEEAKELMETFRKEAANDKPVVVTRRFSLAVLNSLWTIVTGTRNSQDDPKLKNVLDSFNKLGEELTESGIFMFAPWLMKVAPEWTKFNNFLKIAKQFGDVIRDTIKTHKGSLPEPGNARDFVDVYMHEIKKTTDPYSSFFGETGDKNLYALLGDLFQAGAETTSATLSWTMLYLGGHPLVQQKLQEEIDLIIGQSNTPSLADRQRMPYCDALIMEVLRKSTIVPLGVFHTALADKEFHGYMVEKGTWISANAWGMHYDKAIWGDPEAFRPERFLASDGKTVLKNEALIPFSIGKRQCLGESLARDTLFLFITTIFQRFNVQIHLPNGGKPDYEPTIAFLLNPKKFEVIMKDRLDNSSTNKKAKNNLDWLK